MFKVGDKVIRIDDFEDVFEPKNNLKANEIYVVSKVNITGLTRSTMTDVYLRGKTRRYSPNKFRLAYVKETFICKNPKNLPKE